MPQPFIAACVQYGATPDVQADIATALRLMTQAAERGATLIALPELCAGLSARDGKFVPHACAEAEHPALAAFADFARQRAVQVLIGSIGVLAGDGRTFNRSLLLDAQGRVAARYDKIHLFDIDLPDGTSFRESASIAPGERAVVADLEHGRLGLSVCYDLRFPTLYRSHAQQGAVLLAVPSAFTVPTGQAHWHVLVRARAIENGAYVIAPGQCGVLAGGAAVYGHSLIVDPWGEVLADAGGEPGVICAEIDLQRVADTRRRIPSLANERTFSA